MPQVSFHIEDDYAFPCYIPDPDTEVLPGVIWGLAGKPFSPAYWKLACSAASQRGKGPTQHRLGTTIAEEVIACMLGGHGVSGELGVAAFRHLKERGLFDGSWSQAAIEHLLRQPLQVGRRSVKYRFPRQKAGYIAEALHRLSASDLSTTDGGALRNQLLGIKGIGLKTGSWIARNWLAADNVAVLDIHVHRAGVLIGLFSPRANVQTQYLDMESQYLALAERIDTAPALLDHQIWNTMRGAPRLVRERLMALGVRPHHRCGLPASYGGRPK